MKETSIFNIPEKKIEIKLKKNPVDLPNSLYVRFLKDLINCRDTLKNTYDILDSEEKGYLKYAEYAQNASVEFLKIAALSIDTETYDRNVLENLKNGINISHIISSYRGTEQWEQIEYLLYDLYDFFGNDNNFDMYVNEEEINNFIENSCIKRMPKLKKCIGALNFLIILYTDSPNILNGELYNFMEEFCSEQDSDKSILEEALSFQETCTEIFNKFKPEIELVLKYPNLAEDLKNKINNETLYIKLIELSNEATINELKQIVSGDIKIEEYIDVLIDRLNEIEE